MKTKAAKPKRSFFGNPTEPAEPETNGAPAIQSAEPETTPDQFISAIQSAEIALNDEREKAADLGGRFEHFEAGKFWDAWGAFCIAIKTAIDFCESSRDGGFLQKLLPILGAVQRGITIRRAMETDQVNSPESNHTKFLLNFDNALGFIKRLNVEPTGERVDSIGKMTAAKVPLAQIRRIWEHRPDNPTGLSYVDVTQIMDGTQTDIPGSQHPIEIQWRAAASKMPNRYDDSILAGYCREVERSRERTPAGV